MKRALFLLPAFLLLGGCETLKDPEFQQLVAEAAAKAAAEAVVAYGQK